MCVCVCIKKLSFYSKSVQSTQNLKCENLEKYFYHIILAFFNNCLNYI